MQNVLKEADLPTGNSLFMFSQSLGTVIALPIAQAIFLRTLNERLDARLPDAEATQIKDLGASSVDDEHIDADLVPFVAAAYGYAVQAAVYVAAAAAVVAFVTAGLMEWKKLDYKEKPAEDEGPSDSAENAPETLEKVNMSGGIVQASEKA